MAWAVLGAERKARLVEGRVVKVGERLEDGLRRRVDDDDIEVRHEDEDSCWPAA